MSTVTRDRRAHRMTAIDIYLHRARVVGHTKARIEYLQYILRNKYWKGKGRSCCESELHRIRVAKG